MGKAEGHGTNWHGHVTALSVAPDYRRLGLAAKLMSGLEEISEKYSWTATRLLVKKKKLKHHCALARRKQAYFVDLFVRVSNTVAINMYKNLGYIIYRTVLEYYSGSPDEDAYGNIDNFFTSNQLVIFIINSRIVIMQIWESLYQEMLINCR